LVVFGGRLFANVAGPNQNESTLFSILGLAGEVLSNKGGWRDVGF
jgi:type IV pilus assembly protein PilY1